MSKKTLIKRIRHFYTHSVINLNWLRNYYKLIIGSNCLSDINVISIEFCSVCNLRCKYCFLERKNRPTYLDIKIYEKLIREICENKRYKIKIMEWPISGEFLLHPNYKEIILMTKKYKEKYQNFKPWIILNDNIMLLNEEKIDLIVNSNVINQIICSIDGRDKKSLERLRPNAKSETIIKNMNSLIKKNEAAGHPIIIEINNGCDSVCEGKKLSSKMRAIFDKVDHVRFWTPQNYNESFHMDSSHYTPKNGFCSFIFNSISISSSGKVIKCCMDLKELTDYDDLTKNTLESIWHSNNRKNFLRFMLQGKRSSIHGCSNCSIDYTNIYNKYNIRRE